MSRMPPNDERDASNPEVPRRSSPWPRVRISRLFPSTIRSTILLLLLVVIVPIVLVEISHYYELFRERRAEAFRNEVETARLASQTLSEYVSNIRRLELEIGAALMSPERLSAERVNQILAATVPENPAIRHFAWINPQGTIVASSYPAEVGLNNSDRPFFQEILQGKDWVVSNRTP